jgi:hypothetical protein
VFNGQRVIQGVEFFAVGISYRFLVQVESTESVLGAGRFWRFGLWEEEDSGASIF